MNSLRGWLHSELLAHGRIDEVGLQAAFLEEFPSLRRNTIIIEE